jgi:uncharacterized protein YqjF (DUF2071 family)
MRMTWRSLLFLHWPLPPEAVRPLVPSELALDTFDGAAWVGLVPFTMTGVRLRGVPPVPTMNRFPECNVRTYVHRDGEPGVWFFSLDAHSALAVWGARRWWRLNYLRARIEIRYDGDVVHYRLDRDRPPLGQRRGHLHCSWRIGDPRPAARPGDLDYFLTERYMLYTIDRHGRPRRGRIWHKTWPLREATVLELDESLVAAAGMSVPAQGPIARAADPIAVDAWFPRPA